MPFEIVRNDIVHMRVDAIVNTANPRPVVGSGTDAAIHAAAGPRLLEARKEIGAIPTGSARITPGYDLPASYVIHTVGPVWRGGWFGEAKKLRSCYDSALGLAVERGCTSIAFPLISTGNYGFPKDKALQIALEAFSAFLLEHELQIYLVVFNRDAFRLSEKLFQRVESYIDEHYVEERETEEYGAVFSRICTPSPDRSRDWALEEDYSLDYALEEDCSLDYVAAEECAPCHTVPMAAPQAMSLEDMLKNADAGFSETLLKLIDKTGKKDSEIYKKANVTKQHFSKIRKDPDYQPTKTTALAFAIALELDLEATKDLIGRAGFSLSKSSKLDVIVEFFIVNKNYDIMLINETLFSYDQSLLGSNKSLAS